MQIFDISWAAIFKIMGAGAFTYLILPALLVARDTLLHWAIGKFILTDDLNALIMMCESDRWFLTNKYNKQARVSYGANGDTYELDGSPVTKEQFSEYERNRNVHLKRFEYAEAKIIMKHNLITWLTKHYKQADGGNPIPSLREQYYQTAGVKENKSA